MARPRKGTTVADRFWANVALSEGCWAWTGHIGRTNRYGMIRVNGRSLKAHRVAWELHYGPIPDGLVVRHQCDNPRCVRPDHLELGTQAENVADSISRGRFTRAANRDWHGRWQRSTEPVARLDTASSAPWNSLALLTLDGPLFVPLTPASIGAGIMPPTGLIGPDESGR